MLTPYTEPTVLFMKFPTRGYINEKSNLELFFFLFPLPLVNKQSKLSYIQNWLWTCGLLKDITNGDRNDTRASDHSATKCPRG